MGETETAASKSLVYEFYDQVFSRGDTSNLDRFMRNDYIQHNLEDVQSRNGNGIF